MKARAAGLVTGLVPLLALTGCDSAELEPPTQPRTSDLAWEECGDDANWEVVGPTGERREEIEVACATLEVPIDHAEPEGGTVGVAVIRVHSKNQQDRIGSLVLNPGGPAASGLDFMPVWAGSFPDEVLQRFDLVAFDPRGTGESEPIDCPDESATSSVLDVATRGGFDAAVRALERNYRDCARSLGPAPSAFGTDAVARDLDLLRSALGDLQLTYLGLSYGARLGAHYAHLFPDRVRALVLDAPPDPDSATALAVDRQLDGFEAAYDAYVEQCPERPTCELLEGGPATVFERVRERARTEGIPSGRPQGDDPADEALVVRAVLGFMSAPGTWGDLDRVLDEADRGDSGSLHDQVDSMKGATPAHPDADHDDAMDVVLCTDTPRRPPAESLRAEVTELARTHPVFGRFGAFWLLGCLGWPDEARAPLPVPTTTTSAPILVLAGAADPNTPLAGAEALVADLGSTATLLVSMAAGHTSFGTSACVDGHVVDYLVNLSRPEDGTTCQ